VAACVLERAGRSVVGSTPECAQFRWWFLRRSKSAAAWSMEGVLATPRSVQAAPLQTARRTDQKAARVPSFLREAWRLPRAALRADNDLRLP
jgi:hypothetical protein